MTGGAREVEGRLIRFATHSSIRACLEKKAHDFSVAIRRPRHERGHLMCSAKIDVCFSSKQPGDDLRMAAARRRDQGGITVSRSAVWLCPGNQKRRDEVVSSSMSSNHQRATTFIAVLPESQPLLEEQTEGFRLVCADRGADREVSTLRSVRHSEKRAQRR